MDRYLIALKSQASSMSIAKERSRQKVVDNMRLNKVAEARKTYLTELDQTI